VGWRPRPGPRAQRHRGAGAGRRRRRRSHRPPRWRADRGADGTHPGFPGETRTVELTVGGGGVATITDCIGEGLSGAATFDRSLPTTVEYEVTYDQRGVHRLGRTIVRVRDVLGLVETVHRLNETTAVLVYPRVYAVGDPGSFLRTLGPESDERTEFDRLREYVPGDSLRDVHWKSSAKREDLLVTEFTDPADEEAVSIAASADSRYADDMATAAATLFVAAVSVGLTVDLHGARWLPPGGPRRDPQATRAGTARTHRQWDRPRPCLGARRRQDQCRRVGRDRRRRRPDLLAGRPDRDAGEPGPGGGGAVTLVGRVRENRAVEAVDWPRAMALFAVLATLGAALQVMYHFIDVVGLPLAFLAIVAISLVAATALARVLPAWTAVVVAVVLPSRSAWAGT